MSLTFRCDRCGADCTAARHWVEVSDVAVHDLCGDCAPVVAAAVAAAMTP